MSNMSDLNSTISVSPRIGTLLTQVTQTPDLETALWKILSEYIDLKTDALRDSIRTFESKWGMSFSQFSEHCEAGTLDRNAYDYDVESDFWEWEKAETLLKHYESLHA